MKKDDVKLERIYEKHITVFGKPLRIKRLMLISIVGTTLGIMGYIEIKALAWLIFTGLNVFLFIFVYLLQSRSILYFGESSLEATPSGDIFLTKLHGHCSRCDGHIKVIKKQNKTWLQCDKNSEHIWTTNPV